MPIKAPYLLAFLFKFMALSLLCRHLGNNNFLTGTISNSVSSLEHLIALYVMGVAGVFAKLWSVQLIFCKVRWL